MKSSQRGCSALALALALALGKGLLLLLIATFVAVPLWAYRWPLPTRQIVQGFLAGRPAKLTREQGPLPNLGVWFDIEAEGEVVEPYHSGEVIYFETSSEMTMLGSVPKTLHHTVVVQHGKLLFRYSSDSLKFRLQKSYQIDNGDLLFMGPKVRPQGKIKPRLYMEIFDTQFQTVINPKLVMPRVNENLQGSQPYMEPVTLNKTATSRPMMAPQQCSKAGH